MMMDVNYQTALYVRDTSHGVGQECLRALYDRNVLWHYILQQEGNHWILKPNYVRNVTCMYLYEFLFILQEDIVVICDDPTI